MTGPRTARMPDMGVEQGTDDTAGLGQLAVARCAEERRTRCGLHEPEQRAQRGRLTGAVRTEEADNRAALHREADIEDGLMVAVALCEPVDGDDGVGVPARR